MEDYVKKEMTTIDFDSTVLSIFISQAHFAVGLASSEVKVFYKATNKMYRKFNGLEIGPIISIWMDEDSLLAGGLGIMSLGLRERKINVQNKISTDNSLVFDLKVDEIDRASMKVLALVDQAESLQQFNFSRTHRCRAERRRLTRRLRQKRGIEGASDRQGSAPRVGQDG